MLLPQLRPPAPTQPATERGSGRASGGFASSLTQQLLKLTLAAQDFPPAPPTAVEANAAVVLIIRFPALTVNDVDPTSLFEI